MPPKKPRARTLEMLCTPEKRRRFRPGVIMHGHGRMVQVAFAMLEAVWEDIEFSYSNPGAADRGEVWTTARKCPNLYKAYKEYEWLLKGRRR